MRKRVEALTEEEKERAQAVGNAILKKWAEKLAKTTEASKALTAWLVVPKAPTLAI